MTITETLKELDSHIPVMHMSLNFVGIFSGPMATMRKISY
jgi:hypothetical protein